MEGPVPSARTPSAITSMAHPGLLSSTLRSWDSVWYLWSVLHETRTFGHRLIDRERTKIVGGVSALAWLKLLVVSTRYGEK